MGSHTNLPINEDLVRPTIINQIRSIRSKFRNAGQTIIACDSRYSWRRDSFPHYKANRKTAREAGDFDWVTMHTVMNNLADDLDKNFPYVVLAVEKAEADDIIGALVFKYGQVINTPQDEQITIVSGDKDFKQLHIFKNVKQYSPVLKKFLTCDDPTTFLFEQIVRGDKGDGVPNIFMEDDCFVVGTRQKKVMASFLRSFNPHFCQDEKLMAKYERNKRLIDLRCVPTSIFEEVYAQYEAKQPACALKKGKVFNYFITHKMKNLMESIGEFT